MGSIGISSRIIFSFLIMLFSIGAFTQGIVSEENTWHVRLFSFGTITEYYKIEGDTLINGENYKTIWMTTDPELSSFGLMGMLREDSNRVLFISPGFESEQLLYDFNLEIGDTAYITNIFCGWNQVEVEIVVLNIDTVEYEGIPRKRWFINQDYEDYWIEGIGSTMGPLHSMYWECIICPSWNLTCFHKNDTLYYGGGNCWLGVGINESEAYSSIKIYPNPASGKIQISSKEKMIRQIEIFDVYGRKLIDKIIIPYNNEIELNLKDLDAGGYYCRISTENKAVTSKIIVL